MKREVYLHLKTMFITGIIFAAITMVGGEIPIGWAVYPEAENEIVSLIMGCGSLSLLQLACGVFFGGIDFTVWLVLPFSAVFMAIYIPMTIAMLVPVVKGKTIFPKWAIVFNPIMYKILLNVILSLCGRIEDEVL